MTASIAAKLSATISRMEAAIGSRALIRVCDVCGVVNACDLTVNDEHIRELLLPRHTVKDLPRDEALATWHDYGGRCSHQVMPVCE